MGVNQTQALLHSKGISGVKGQPREWEKESRNQHLLRGQHAQQLRNTNNSIVKK